MNCSISKKNNKITHHLDTDSRPNSFDSYWQRVDQSEHFELVPFEPAPLNWLIDVPYAQREFDANLQAWIEWKKRENI